ncbi:alpha/beta fold hydrolase [Candidatus Contubernalis alkaliaceticus]|uniref:alpha/beta fold hydrolase n=1 Tax=Candidatus Contubernalis alkaliaceticus TaxID=338645 RepID=UPI001F4C1468|nr:alpha/beta hydrolase [Candidatus Contubernalis alkalaceticus]UNC92091.1 alpha/beta hydrolase [Candidatus Contubernalis alkalaceticus]
MNILEIIFIILLIVCGLIGILLVTSTINHNYQLRKEAKKYPPPGKLVKVKNHKTHIYVDGHGDNTLIFMSGHGTTNPTIDFKPLWMRMVDEYRIAVVEKAGYGWSETSSSPRDIDTMLKETRQALEFAGEKEPYVLVPHSMSGLEAIYWAQKYPYEVKAIIGLDPTVPDFVDQSLQMPHKTQLYFMYLVSRMGLSRFMPESEVEKTFPLMKSKDLTNED